MVNKNPVELLIEKNKKYLSKMSFKEKALYSILLDCNEPIDVIENVFNPLIRDEKIDKETIEMYCLRHLYKDKKSRINLIDSIVEIISNSPKLSKNTSIFICIDKNYGKGMSINKLSKELGNMFLPISDNLTNQLICTDIEEFIQKAYNKCLVLKLNLSKGLQLLPIRYIINEQQYFSLIIPPLYKWTIASKKYTYLKEELLTTTSKLPLIEQLRIINKYSNIPIMEFNIE